MAKLARERRCQGDLSQGESIMIRPRFVHASAWLILTSLVVGCPSGGPQDSPASDPSGVTGAAEDIGENSSEQDQAAQGCGRG